MKTHKLLLLAVACTWAMGASAQWQWLDKDGRKVFSDRPPPQDVPQKSILKQPSGAVRAAASQPQPTAAASDAAAAAPASAASDAASAPRPAGKDKELEAKKAQAEAAEAAKKKAEADKVAKSRADNCARAKQSKATLTSGQLLSHTNAQGERGFMDDATRAAEVKRADAIIASDCAAR